MALKIIFVHRVFLIALLALLDKLYSGAIQFTDGIVLSVDLTVHGQYFPDRLEVWLDMR